MKGRKVSAKSAAKTRRSKARTAIVENGTISKPQSVNGAIACTMRLGDVADLWGIVIPKNTQSERRAGRPSKREGWRTGDREPVRIGGRNFGKYAVSAALHPQAGVPAGLRA